MQIKVLLEKHDEDIAENEAMLTNTGNKVERLEGAISKRWIRQLGTGSLKRKYSARCYSTR